MWSAKSWPRGADTSLAIRRPRVGENGAEGTTAVERPGLPAHWCHRCFLMLVRILGETGVSGWIGRYLGADCGKTTLEADQMKERRTYSGESQSNGESRVPSSLIYSAWEGSKLTKWPGDRKRGCATAMLRAHPPCKHVNSVIESFSCSCCLPFLLLHPETAPHLPVTASNGPICLLVHRECGCEVAEARIAARTEGELRGADPPAALPSTAFRFSLSFSQALGQQGSLVKDHLVNDETVLQALREGSKCTDTFGKQEAVAGLLNDTENVFCLTCNGQVPTYL